MAEFHELETKYEKIPQEMKGRRQWVCYKAMLRNGKERKVPISPKSDGDSFVNASPTDSSTWGDFDEAVRFCAENDLDGIGFELGEGMFGVDVSNHKDEFGDTMAEAEFQELANEIVKTLDSYTEWSASKNGIHIICFGNLPKGFESPKNVELYGGSGFFAITGNAIGMRTVRNRTNEIEALIAKLNLKKNVESEDKKSENEIRLRSLTDKEVMARAYASQYAPKIKKLMEGDASDYGDDYEKASKALCSFLAHFSNCNEDQVDKLYRNSLLYNQSWDEPEGDKTHGYYVVQEAVEACAMLNIKKKTQTQTSSEMNLDEEGEPIFRISKNYNRIAKNYPLDDTGNAMRFYDCFGENFHWNTKDKMYMFWTGKTWIYDSKDIARKYANKLISLLNEEARQLSQKLDNEVNDNRKKILAERYKAFMANIKHLSSRNGKDAMFVELRSLGTIPAEPTEFDNDKYKINTDSGIVDLRTGEILPFDKAAMFASNTNTAVSYEEPKVWIKFLHDIFQRDDEKETEEIIECYRRCLGYTLCGETSEQVMFLLNGDGSNGKSTQANAMKDVMGDYFGSIDSQQLMVQKNQNNAVQYSLAELLNTRYLLSSETDKGARLSESVVKQITGSTAINAQKKFGRPFQFVPKFKLWMETNNMPFISGKDYGIWRRIFIFSFKRQFKDSEKDKTMPDKLAAEYPMILGWVIQGAVEYLKEKDLKQPECLKMEVEQYKAGFDAVKKFIMSECHVKEDSIVVKSKMYMAYKRWAMDNNEHAYPESKFREEMIAKGYKISVNKVNGSSYYEGLELNLDMDNMVELGKPTWKPGGYKGGFDD